MRSWLVPASGVLSILVPAAVLAAAPVVTTVPADPNNSLTRHDVISGRPTTLKGAADISCAGVCTWTWDPGDGDPVITGDVDVNPTDPSQLNAVGYNPYWAIWAEHTYSAAVGTAFTATLTVDNGADPPVTAQYRVQVRANELSAEVNAAIDEALWNMHRNQFRFDGTETGAAGGTIAMGRWDYPQDFGSAVASVTGASVNAFEANGYLETGPSTSPYTDTVRRGLRYAISRLIAQPLTIQTVGDLSGNGRSDDPDTNGNGVGVTADDFSQFIEFDTPYQNGMIMDAIIASGSRGTVAVTGGAGVIGETYGDIIQDMSDWYAWAQSDSTQHGGWQYSAFDNSSGSHDNSASGWAAIGLVAARDIFGANVPDFVSVRNVNGLAFTGNEGDNDDRDGIHGYSSQFEIWGPFGVTGAAMVQMDLDSIPSTTSATPDDRWIRSENYFRRHFNDAAGGDSFKNYYYGMFNFAKAMRSAKPQPVVDIGTQVGAADGGVGCGPNPGCVAGGPQPLDWYNDPVNGVARTVIDYQILPGNANTEVFCGAPQPGPCPNIGGFTDRPGNSQGSNQDDHNTPWATQILTRTLFQAGPIAVATARPNPTGDNVPVTFDPSGSFHQDPAHTIVLYEWDFDNDGVFDTSTDDPSTVVHSFPCASLPCSYPVTLRVTDDNDPALTSEAVVTIDVTVPPHAPTAISGGPYQVCVGVPVQLDGSESFDIDEGTSESGNPPFDTITAYDWDLDLSSGAPFDSVDAVGAEPSLPAFTDLGTFDIALRVTDNTALAFPSAGSPDLTNIESTTLEVVTCPVIDLSLSATADPDTILIGQSSTVTFTVSNGGPDATTGATVDIVVPANGGVDSATPETGTCVNSAGQVSCTLDPIAAGTSVDIVLGVTPAAAGDFSYDGTATPANLDQDTDLTNDDASATVSVLAQAGDVDLAITGSADPDSFDVGDSSTVTFTVTNNGPDDASSAEVTITLPAGLSADSATTDGGTCDIDGATITCALDAIANGASVDIEVVIGATDGGTLTMEATVATGGLDVDNNEDNDSTIVSVIVRDVIDIVVKGTGGSGATGLLELLALALVAPFVRKRRFVAGGMALLLVVGLTAAPRSFAEGHWYIGGSAGSTDAGIDASDYSDMLAGVGISANNVSFDDTDVGWKVYGGFNINDYIGLEAGYTDLGEMKSSFGTTVAPGDVEAVVDTAASVQPFFAGGATFSVVGKVPLGEHFEVFGKVGAFVWDNAEGKTHVSSPSGRDERAVVDHDGSDVLYGVGISFALGGGWHVRGEWERYTPDNQDVDFISFGVERRIPRN